jgi:hypothetical protein
MVVIVVTANRVDVVILSHVARRSSCLVSDNVFQISIFIMVYGVGELIEIIICHFPHLFLILREQIFIYRYVFNKQHHHTCLI